MPESPSLRVAQLNIGSLFEPEWERRRHEIVAWLERLDADVVCFQEAWEDRNTPNTVDWVVEHHQPSTGSWHQVFGGFPFPGQLWADPTMRFGSAILSRWPIDHHELIPLPVDEAASLPHFRIELELLHARTAGLDLFSTHLVPAPAHAYHRVQQVLFIEEAIRARDGGEGGMPPILCGDFNAEPESDEVRFLTSTAVIEGRSTYFQDAWKVAGPGGPGWTQDPTRNPVYAAMHLPRKRIDYVFVGDPFQRRGAGVVQRCELAFHEPITSIVASDHFGLVVDIAWPARPNL